MIHDAELFTVGPDEVVVTFRSDADDAVTTVVGDREVTTHGPYHSARVAGLEPATKYALRVDGVEPGLLLPGRLSTLARPAGKLLATVATVNDVHFGEVECGRLGTPEELGPILSTAPGEEPYPEVMNAGAIAEIAALNPDAVVVKGDLTDRGTEAEYQSFLDIDTVRPGSEHGRVTRDQLDWLDSVAEASSAPVLVFGHHHPWDPSSTERNEHYFGINPGDSEALCAVITRRESIAGYFAGHTHRNRVRRFDAARGVPIVEIACVKDYPGAWAEYRVYEGGYSQLAHRIATPAAMAWTEQTRAMFAGLYRDYALGRLEDRCFTQTF